MATAINMQHHQLIILGSGPAGCTAAIYAARANLQTVVITGPEQGGQLVKSTMVDNWPGDVSGISGAELMERMVRHAQRFVPNMISDRINKVELKQKPFILQGDTNTYSCDALIIATGASPRYLGIPSEQVFLGKGLSTCATCDGFFYRNAKVAVVGGGNTAIDEALYLAEIAKEVFLIHRRDSFRADQYLVSHLLAKAKEGKIHILWNSTVDEILGDDSGVNAVKIKNIATKEIQTIELQGVFLAIGNDPNTALFIDQLETAEGYIKIKNTDQGNCTATNIPGVFAAGDVANPAYRQAITAAAMGCMAALDAKKLLGGQVQTTDNENLRGQVQTTDNDILAQV